MSDARLAELQAKLDARVDRDGSAKPGYARNVEAIRAEIARLQREQSDGQPG